MLQGEDETCSNHCDTYYAMVDTLTAVDSLIAEITVEAEEYAWDDIPPPLVNDSPYGETLQSSTEESAWTALEANVSELNDSASPQFEDIYQPAPMWQRPAGHALQGIDAFKLLCHVNCLKEAAAIVVGDSGAAPTLISERFLSSLKWSQPKPRTGQKLKLLELTGSAKCSEYVRLNLYFRSQFGPVCFKGVEAYVVKDMKANMIIGEDTQLAWQLDTIRKNGARSWQVGDSAHRIPGIAGPAPTESFTAQWRETETDPKPRPKKRSVKTRTEWKAIAKQDVLIKPEAIATVTIVSKGAPKGETMFLEAIPLKRGGDSFASAPHGLVDLDQQDSVEVKIANTTKRNIHRVAAVLYCSFSLLDYC